jgi:hypothetical protein
MNVDYEEALKRAERLIENGEVSREVMGRVFKELNYTRDQQDMAKCLELLENIGKLGRNANFDRYTTADMASWVNIIRKAFFENDITLVQWHVAEDVIYETERAFIVRRNTKDVIATNNVRKGDLYVRIEDIVKLIDQQTAN